MTKRVYPVPGFWLNDVPAVEHDCDEPRCVESGAFTTKRPPPETPATDIQDPPDGGSSDSIEES